MTLKRSDQRMDIRLVMCPEIDTLKSNTIPKYLGIHAALKVFKNIEKKILLLRYFQEISSIIHFLSLQYDHLTRGKKSRFHTGECRIV